MKLPKNDTRHPMGTQQDTVPPSIAAILIAIALLCAAVVIVAWVGTR